MKYLHHQLLLLVFSIVLTLIYPPNIFAEAPSYVLPIIRDGKKMDKVAYNAWSGEYPGPVIDVNAQKSGSTQIKIYKSLRDLNTSQSCRIVNGIYHPWSKTKNSLLRFYSIIDFQEYVSLIDQVIDEQNIKKGDLVAQVRYLSEGYCGGLLSSKKVKDKELELNCSELEDHNKFRLTRGKTGENKFLEQWLQVKCIEGHIGFVRDKELLKFKGVKEGSILGYGEVGPASQSPNTTFK